MNATSVRRRAVVTMFAALVMIAGCAGQQYVRESTEITAGHVEHLRGDYDRYLQRVERDAVTRIEMLAQERQRLARGEQSLQQVPEWRPETRSLHETLMAEGAERIKTERAIAQRAETERTSLLQGQKKIERDALDKLKGLAKQLHELATPAPFNDQVKFLVEYFQAVGKAASDLDAKARDAKDKAEKTQGTSSQ